MQPREMKEEEQAKGVSSEVDVRWDSEFLSNVEVVSTEEVGDNSDDVGEGFESGAYVGEGVGVDEMDGDFVSDVGREESGVHRGEVSVGDIGREGGEEGGCGGGGR